MIVNFRDVRDRFWHVDGLFESCAVAIPGEAHYAVRFYAWWENPAYLALVEAGAAWEFAGWPATAEKVVTVYAVALIKACVRPREEVIEWSFIDSHHPQLWEYESWEEVTCATPLPADGVDRLSQLVREALPYEADSASISSLLNEWIWAHREAVARPGGFSLGRFPVSVVGAVRSALDDLDVSYFGAPVEVSDQPLPVMLLIDDEDYLIAEDFDVDVPDFVHDSAWVSAAGAAVDPRLRSARPDELPREYPGR